MVPYETEGTRSKTSREVGWKEGVGECGVRDDLKRSRGHKSVRSLEVVR